MEPLDFWPLIDTSLKVALGAAITLVAGWAMNRGKAVFGTGEPTPENRRLELLEQVSADVGNVNHIFAKYAALVIESTRFGARWPAARRAELEKVNQELVAAFKKMADAESRLLMLGEKLMEKTLRLYSAKIAYFRKQVYVGRQDIGEKEIAAIRQEIAQLREQFYDILSKKYDRLLETARA